MFRVITISRQYGSGGGEIARRIANRLEWRLVDRSVVNEIAARARVSPSVAAEFDERVDPWFHRMVQALWQGGFEGVASATPSLPVNAESVAALSAQIVHEAAALGDAVIVGRGAQCILHHDKRTFHVSIYAPRNLRVANLRERLPQVTDIEAVMDETDRQRAAYVRRYFNHDWTERWLYHMSICASVGIETAVDSILCASALAPLAHV
jgi:cytidylate kinase